MIGRISHEAGGQRAEHNELDVRAKALVVEYAALDALKDESPKAEARMGEIRTELALDHDSIMGVARELSEEEEAKEKDTSEAD